MTQEFTSLTDADVIILKEVIRTVGKLRENPPLRDDSDLHRNSPDVYIAKPQSAINGLSGTTPGIGKADIYVLNTATGRLYQHGLFQTVYNLSTSVISSTYQLIIKDKFGRWVLVTGGGGGGSCNTVRFRLAAPIAGTMSAICFIHAVDAGFTINDVPGKANLEFPGNPYPGTPNIIVCDPMCSFFNEPASGLTNRLGWAKYMQPLIPNTCQPSYLIPQWEVFALNCVYNPIC